MLHAVSEHEVGFCHVLVNINLTEPQAGLTQMTYDIPDGNLVRWICKQEDIVL